MARPEFLTGARLLALWATATLHLLVVVTLASILDFRPDNAQDRGAALTVVTLRTRPPVAARKEGNMPSDPVSPAASSRLPRSAERLPTNGAGLESPSPPHSSANSEVVTEAAKPAEVAIARLESGGRPSAAELTSALEIYRATLWRQIDAHRPRGVIMRGTAIVRFRLSPDGALIESAVSRTSGLIQLDKIALRSVRQAAPFPRAPATMADSQLTFEIPINFR